MTTQNKGFTLIELLVVITIIAILSAIGLTFYSGIQKNARITKRIEDLKAIQTALEIYYSVNKAYPIQTTWTTCTSGITANITGLSPTYMLVIPSDPSGGCYSYISDSAGSDYKLRATPPSGEMVASDYLNQRNLIDPNRDGGSGSCVITGGVCPTTCIVDPPCSGTGTCITNWAIYSSQAPACW